MLTYDPSIKLRSILMAWVISTFVFVANLLTAALEITHSFFIFVTEYNVKRKKRKIGLPYAGGVSVSQILAHREKLALNQHSFNKEAIGNSPQVSSPTNCIIISLIKHPVFRYGPSRQSTVHSWQQIGCKVIQRAPKIITW